VDQHPVAHDRCRKKFVKETNMLIKEEVSHTPYVNFFTTSLSGSKYFLAKHLFNGNIDGNVKIFKDNQLEQIHDKFIKLNSPNVRNLISMF
jgi:hypothetical protein